MFKDRTFVYSFIFNMLKLDLEINAINFDDDKYALETILVQAHIHSYKKGQIATIRIQGDVDELLQCRLHNIHSITDHGVDNN